MIQIILLIIGFAIIIKGADLLVSSASAIARKLRVSDFAIGLTVVAFGTSLPELSVNVSASLKGTSEIAFGNIIGSNIANIFLVLGISALIFPLTVNKGTVWKEIPLVLLVTLVLWTLSNDRLIDDTPHSFLSRIDGFVLLSFFLIFIYYSCSIAQDIRGMDDHLHEQPPLTKSVISFLLGLVGLVLGGQMIIDSAVSLAQKIGMSNTFIGLTIVALGTSLPELVTSAVAAWKKNPEIAVGNVVGSNIFNVTFILGISAILRPVALQKGVNIDITVAVLSSLLLFLFMFTGGKKILDRWEGALFIIVYISYIAYIIGRG